MARIWPSLSTSGDGLRDDQEDKNGDGNVDLGETDPNNPDTDHDGLDDHEELTPGEDSRITDPQDPDTDNDNLSDGQELILETDPNQADTDMDGLDDQEEVTLGADGYLTDPLDPYTDSDDLNDKEEFENHTSPIDPDTDKDGLLDHDEITTYHSSPILRDTDGDGLDDFKETQALGTDPNQPDTDSDDLSDLYEVINMLDPNHDDSQLDPDDDGLSNFREKVEGTMPQNSDTDGDRLRDGDEVDIHHTQPLDPHSDDDGLPDGMEVEYGTNPLDNDSDDDWIDDGVEPLWNMDLDGDGLINAMDTDSDGDGLFDYEEDTNQNGLWDKGETSATKPDSDEDRMMDFWEITWGFDPLNPNDGYLDMDGDGLINSREFLWNSDPNSSDSDNDGIPDKEEVDEGLKPTDPNDAFFDLDEDGLSNLIEHLHGLKIGEPDSDGDRVIDGEEPNWNQDTDGDGYINALDSDSDGDGLSDGKEMLEYLTYPLIADTDKDDLSDGDEVLIHRTSPLVKDTDDDGIEDGEEVTLGADGYITDPLLIDTDRDGLTDYDEINNPNFLTDPNDKDTDGDGLSDGEEIIFGINPLADDTDGDLLSDGQELALGTDPKGKDSDFDGVWDGYDPDPRDKDMDNDGINDGEEIIHGYSGFVFDPNEWGDLVDDPKFSQQGILITMQSPLVFDLKLSDVSPIRGCPYRLYFQARSIVDPNTLTVIEDKMRVRVTALDWPPYLLGSPILWDQGYPLLKRIYRYFSIGNINPPPGVNWLRIEVFYEYPSWIIHGPIGIMLTSCIFAPEYEMPIFLRTLASDPDMDKDGVIDGQESFSKTYWFEAELYPPDPAIPQDPNTIALDQEASNSLAIFNNLIPDQKVFNIPAAGFLYPAGLYKIFVRARKDPIKDINAQLSLLVSVPGQNPFKNSISLTDRFEWQPFFSPIELDHPAEIEIIGWADSNIVGSVFVDKICIAPILGDLNAKRPRNIIDPMDQDTDGDGYRADEGVIKGSKGYLTDKFEMDIGTNPFDIDTDADADVSPTDSILDDIDNDGRPDYTDDTDPNPLTDDTDADGLLDRIEFDPNHLKYMCDDDRDDDGILDGNEDRNLNGRYDPNYPAETDLMNSDTDGDGIQDGTEMGLTKPQGGYGITDSIIFHTDANIFVPDQDPNSITKPLKIDSDGDTLPDGQEDPNFNGRQDDGETSASEYDSDFDGLNDNVEINLYNTDPTDADTDDDGLIDGAEINAYQTDPNNKDTDGDDLNDYVEVKIHSTDPNLPDMDWDGINDGDEVTVYFTNPRDNDTDRDGLPDPNEINIHFSNPNNPDTDGDGLIDANEVDPNGPYINDNDSDNDGFKDGLEVESGSSPMDNTKYPEFYVIGCVKVKADQWLLNDGNQTLIGTKNIKIGPADHALFILNDYPIRVASCDQGASSVSINLKNRTINGYGEVQILHDPFSMALDPENMIKIPCGGFSIDPSNCLLECTEGSIDPNKSIAIGNYGAFISSRPFVSISEVCLESVNVTNGLIRGKGKVSVAGLFSNSAITSNLIYRIWHQNEDIINVWDSKNAEPPFTISIQGGFEIDRYGWLSMGYDPNDPEVTILNPFYERGDVTTERGNLTIRLANYPEINDAIQAMIEDIIPQQGSNLISGLGITLEEGMLNLQNVDDIVKKISSIIDSLGSVIDISTVDISNKIRDYANILISAFDYIMQIIQETPAPIRQVYPLMINYRSGTFFGLGRWLNIPKGKSANPSIYFDLPPEPLFINFWMNPYFSLMQHWASQTKPGDIHFLFDQTQSSPFPLFSEHEFLHRLAYAPDKGHFIFQMRWNIEEALVEFYGRLDPLSGLSFEPNVYIPEDYLDPNIQSFDDGAFMVGINASIPTKPAIALQGEGIERYYDDPNGGIEIQFGFNGDAGIDTLYTSFGATFWLAGGTVTALFDEQMDINRITLGNQDEVKVSFAAGPITLESLDFTEYAQFVFPMRTNLVIADFENKILTLYMMTRYLGFTFLLDALKLDYGDPREGISGCAVVDYSILSHLFDPGQLDPNNGNCVRMCGSINAQGCFDFDREVENLTYAGFDINDAYLKFSCDGLQFKGTLQAPPIGEIDLSGLIAVEKDHSITYEFLGSIEGGCFGGGFCLADANVVMNNDGLIVEGEFNLPGPLSGSIDLSGQIFNDGSYDQSGIGALNLAGYSVSKVTGNLVGHQDNFNLDVKGNLSLPHTSNTVQVKGEIDSNSIDNFSLKGHGSVYLLDLGISGDFILSSTGLKVENASVSFADTTLADANLIINTNGSISGSGTFDYAGKSIDGHLSISPSGSVSLSGSSDIYGKFGDFSVNGHASFSLDPNKKVKASFYGKVETIFTITLKKPWGGKVTKSKPFHVIVGPAIVNSDGEIKVNFPFWYPKLTNWSRTRSKGITLDIM